MRSLLPPDMAMQGPCSRTDSLRNSITLWKEQEMLVDRMGPKIRAIHRSRNVSHFHESWMECAIVDRLSLSLWFVCLTPRPLPFSSHSSPIWIAFLPLYAPQNLFVSMWVRTIPGQALQQHLQLSKGGKKNRKQNPFVASFQCISTANYLQRTSTVMPVLWNDINVVMATIFTYYAMLFHNLTNLTNIRYHLLNGNFI